MGVEALADEEKVNGAAPSPVAQQVVEALKESFPELEPVVRPDGWVEVNVPAERWHEVALRLRDDAKLRFDYLGLLSAVDYKERGFQVVYHLHSLLANKKLVVKVDVPGGRENPVVDSVVDVWPTANWHEREAWDLMGVSFKGHPDLRRILMPENWVGHPLRKDYVDTRPPRERVTRETYRAAHTQR